MFMLLGIIINIVCLYYSYYKLQSIVEFITKTGIFTQKPFFLSFSSTSIENEA